MRTAWLEAAEHAVRDARRRLFAAEEEERRALQEGKHATAETEGVRAAMRHLEACWGTEQRAIDAAAEARASAAAAAPATAATAAAARTSAAVGNGGSRSRSRSRSRR